MADTQKLQQNITTGTGPVLRPGRPADPAASLPATSKPAPGPASEAGPETAPAPEQAPATPESGGDASSPIPATMGQHRRRQLLRQCERVLLLDFDTLAMAGWPDSYSLARARRRRDLWLFGATLSALVFLSGMTGLVPAWIAGGGFGATVLVTLAGVPAIRRLYSSQPSYLDLVTKRSRLMREARKHIAHLENDTGLVWQCTAMAEYNPALRSPRFSGLVNLSERRILARTLTRREHIRLVLIFLLEAEKAYGRLETAYLEGHQQALDEGHGGEGESAPEPGQGPA